jgi:hypothetical protein
MLRKEERDAHDNILVKDKFAKEIKESMTVIIEEGYEFVGWSSWRHIFNTCFDSIMIMNYAE